MKKIREVIRLRFDRGASIGQIATACKMGRSTVGEYLDRAAGANITWPLPEGLSDAELQSQLFPAKRKANSRPVPDWNEVRKQLTRKGVTLLLLWQEYIALNPEGYGYTRYTGLFKNWLATSELSMLQPHKAGEKLWVDWAGLKMSLADAETGELSEISVFVSAMGSSQMIFARAFESENSRNWLEAHVSAFGFYGAMPELVVPDNLKTGVHSPNYYDPELNPAYAELARFYDVAVLPARVKKPRDKAKVENAVQQVERWVLAPLRNRVFFSLEELNEAIAERLCELNDRLMKGPKASRAQLFLSEDKPAMRQLPERRFSYAEWKAFKIGPDYHFEIEGHRYSVPYSFVGKKVDVRFTQWTVEAYHGSKRIASHARSLSRRGYTTDPSHRPEKHAHADWSPGRFIRWAEQIGDGAADFVTSLLESKVHPEQAYRMCLGVMKLEKTYGRERLNAACKRAFLVGSLRYASVKSILERNMETEPVRDELSPLPSHSNVRGGAYYARETICAKSR